RQSRELGQSEWVLDRLTAPELLRLIEELRSGPRKESTRAATPPAAEMVRAGAGAPEVNAGEAFRRREASAGRAAGDADREASAPRGERIVRLEELDAV